MYDGIPEFWVVVRETGKRTETQSFERNHTKQSKAPWFPKTCCQTVGQPTMFLKFSSSLMAGRWRARMET